MNRKYLTAFIAGLCIFALMGATFKTLVLDESGNCGQSVNFTGTTQLNGVAVATQAYSEGVVSSHNADGTAHPDKMNGSNNLSDVSSASTARTNLGIGTAGTQNVGTSAGNVVQLDGSAKLPAVDGSQLTNLPAAGESNTASNLGAGVGVFAQKSSVDLQFKSLVAGTNIEITYDSTGITISATGSAAGEANTASNIGTGGVGIFAQKIGVDLQFKSIIAGSNKLLVSDDTTDSEIAIDVQPGNIAHQDLSGAGTNTHAQIDSHISSTSNPHSVTAAQAGAVATSGNETVAGIKTFSSFPVTPSSAPTSDYEVANKKYVDDNAGGGSGSTSDTSWTGANWTSTSSSPSQRAIEEALDNVGIDTLASALESSDNDKILTAYYTSDSAITSGGVAKWSLINVLTDGFGSYTLTNSGLTFSTDAAFPLGSRYVAIADGSSFASVSSTGFPVAGAARTVTAWIKTSDTNSSIFSYGSGAGAAFEAMVSGGYLSVSNYSGSCSDTTLVNTGAWKHVAFVFNGSAVAFYINGSLSTSQNFTTNTASGTTAHVACGLSEAYKFTGSLADVRLYDRAITAEEVATIYGGEPAVQKYTPSAIKTSDVALKSNVLELDNTTEYTPTADYHPVTKKYFDDNVGSGGTTDNAICQGRLTLESGVPVSTTDQTAKTTLYFTPYNGNLIGIYSGTAWSVSTFTEKSLSLSGYTANKNYDIWIYDNAGTLTLDSTIWTDDTTRATALTTQDGIYVKTGATTRRYLGTIRITATTGQCEDSGFGGTSGAKRFVWNYYNQVDYSNLSYDTTDTWTDSGNGTYSICNSGNAAWKHEFVVGVANPVKVNATVLCVYSNSSYPLVAVGFNSTIPDRTKTSIVMNGNTGVALVLAEGRAYLPAGYSYVAALNSSRGTGAATFVGDSAVGDNQSNLITDSRR